MRTLLFAARDVTPANYVRAMLTSLQAHFSVMIRTDEKGAACKSFTGTSCTAETALIDTFDVLLLGASNDGAFEIAYLERAHALKVPVIGICDIQGAERRHGGQFADHYLVPNEWAASGLRKRRIPYTVVGDSNVGSLPQPTDNLSQAMHAWRNDAPCIVWAAHEDTVALEIIVQCLQPRQKLVCGLHPDPNKWPDQTRVRAILSTLDEQAIVASNVCDGMNTMYAIACIPPGEAVVVTSWSGAGTAAASAGYPVALASSSLIQHRFAEVAPPGGTLPLAYLIGSPVITTETRRDLFSLTYPHQDRIRAKLAPFGPSTAVAAILAHS